MALRRVDSFATDSPDKLAVQLSQLEDNVAAALELVLSVPQFTDWVSSNARPIQLVYTLIARVDTSISALYGTLPSLSPDFVGHLVGVKVKGANNFTLEPVESTALIDGAASVTLAAGLYLYMHDGTEWSRYG